VSSLEQSAGNAVRQYSIATHIQAATKNVPCSMNTIGAFATFWESSAVYKTLDLLTYLQIMCCNVELV